MSEPIYVYRLSFSSDASTSERSDIVSRLTSLGFSISPEYSTQRSGPFGLDYSHTIEYVQVTIYGNWENSNFNHIFCNDPMFAKCTLSQPS